MGHVRVTVGSCIYRSNIWVMLESLWGQIYRSYYGHYWGHVYIGYICNMQKCDR